MELYNDTCFECSKLITTRYSTSFSRGIRAFHKRFREPIYAIYGFVRYADEIVDTFQNFDRSQLINDFEADVFKAIKQKISLNPVLQSYQLVVNQYNIDNNLTRSFLASMKIDLDKKVHDDASYKNYIHGSAEVIGLMCLRIFCEGDEQLYQQLSSSACSLGSALQKINFLRDIRADYHERGRIYFPGINLQNFTTEEKKQIEADIEKDLQTGFAGIKQLPDGARFGVYIAYIYYRQLFEKIRRASASTILQRRIRVSNIKKTLLYGKALLQHRSGLI